MISRSEVIRMAELARLELSEAEIGQYQEDLNRFLRSGAALRQVDTSGVDLITYVGRAPTRMRADHVEPSLPQAKALSNGPQVVDGYFRVPRVMEDAE